MGEARERYRNTLFDREAKAAASLLEQVRQHVGRAGKCQVADFEDLCTIHHAISNLYERVKRFSSLEAMPRVYRNAVKAPERPQPDPVDAEAQLLMLQGTDELEEPAVREQANAVPPAQAPAPLFDLVRKVPEISMEDLCRGTPPPQPAQAQQGVPTPSPPKRPTSSARRRRPAGATPTPKSRPNSVAKTKTPEKQAPPAAELFVEVFMELGNTEGQALQEMRLEIQVVELPSRTPLRSLRVLNTQGSVGTVVLEVQSLRRAELCMALVKETNDNDRPRLSWDENEEFSILTPDGRTADVASALRVPVSQLLQACAAGASLEWAADSARCLVVQGRLLRAGKAVEYIPGQLEPKSTPEPAGGGANAAANLRAEAEAAYSGLSERQASPFSQVPASLVSRYVSRVLLRSATKRLMQSA